MGGEEKPFKSLDIILDLAREKLHFQSEQWNSIDQKNAIVLAVYGIILAFVTTVDLTKFGNIPICIIESTRTKSSHFFTFY